MLVVVVVAWVVVAYISGAVSTLTVYVKVGVGTDSMRIGEDTPYTYSTIIVYTVLYKPRIEVVIQESSKPIGKCNKINSGGSFRKHLSCCSPM